MKIVLDTRLAQRNVIDSVLQRRLQLEIYWSSPGRWGLMGFQAVETMEASRGDGGSKQLTSCANAYTRVGILYI